MSDVADQTPSVGRIVHYVSYGTPGGEYTSQCRAAIITSVGEQNEDGSFPVGLCVLNPTGMFFNEHVPLDHGAVEPRRGGTWHWPERT